MRATLKYRRGKKEMKQDQKDHYAGMAEHDPTEGAKRSVASGQENTEKV